MKKSIICILLLWFASAGSVRSAGLPYFTPLSRLSVLYVIYVERAQFEMELLSKDKRFVNDSLDQLQTQMAILESRMENGVNFRKGVDRARRIENPFYASLALGGIAVLENPSFPYRSTQHFLLALDRTSSITHYTGTYPNSKALLIGAIPSFGKDAIALLASTQESFDDIRAGYEGMPGEEQALLALSQVIVEIAPERAESFLIQEGTKYSSPTICLATFLAHKSVEDALRLAEKIKGGSQEYHLGSVLAVLAETDFPRAFQRIKEMPDFGRQSAAEQVAIALAARKRYPEVEEIINYLNTLTHNWKENQIARIRRQMAPSPPDKQSAGVEMIEDFLANPDSTKLEMLSEKKKIAFRDRAQVTAFIDKALPLASQIQDMGYPHHGSPHSSALGLLFLCSARTHDGASEALEIAGQIKIPEVRAAYLLSAAEAINPLPTAISEWPIRFWPVPQITILQ